MHTLKWLRNRRLTSLVVALVVGVTGVVLLTISHAATPAASQEAESGTVTGNASTLSDDTASGGSGVAFGKIVYSHLVWSDEFNGPAGTAPDSSKWTSETGGAGWGNNELECYTNSTDNAHMDGTGDLVISALSTPNHTCSDGHINNYTSARLDTYNKENLQYGRMEARMKVPNDPGTWPAFWAVGTDESQAPYWPFCGEIDTMEAVGNHPGTTFGTIHGPQYNSDGSYKAPYGLGGTTTLPAGQLLSDTYHVYGVNWSPYQISFDFDGKTYYTITKAQVQAYNNPSYTWEFDKPFFMRLNLAIGGNFPGSPTSATTFPQQMLVDYVRVYK